jgi:hypothetical protein
MFSSLLDKFNEYNMYIFIEYLAYTILFILFVQGLVLMMIFVDSVNSRFAKVSELKNEVRELKDVVKSNNIKINMYQDNLLLLKNNVDNNNINKESLLIQYQDIHNILKIMNFEINKKIDYLDERNSFILIGFEDYLDKSNFYRQRYFFNHKNSNSEQLFNNINGNYRKNHYYYIILSQLKFLPNVMKHGIQLKQIINPSIIIITNKNVGKITEYDINNQEWFNNKHNTISFVPGTGPDIYSSNATQIEQLQLLCFQYGIHLLKDEIEAIK